VAWYDNDDLWAELLPFLLEESMLRAAATEASQAATLLGSTAGAHLLDLGCGPGRHAVELARLGYRVTGVDRTAAYLERARSRAAEAGVELELIQESMLRFRRDETFHGAVSLLTSFGYFEDRADELRVLRNVHASLKPGARLIVDVMGKEVLAPRFAPRTWNELPGGRLWIQQVDVEPGWEFLRMRWIFTGAGKTREFSLFCRLYSGVELRDLLRDSGFADIMLYGHLDGRPYNRDAARLVAVATKADG